MKKRLSILKWALIPVFVVAAVAVLGLLDSYRHTDKEELYLTPAFANANGWEIYTQAGETRTELTPQELMGLPSGQTFYLARILNEDLKDGGYSFLYLDSLRPAAVFLDGRLLYTTCPDAKPQEAAVQFPAEYAGLSGRGESVRITLPEDFVGKRLSIATAHTDSPSMPSVIFSSQAIETERLTTDASREMIPAAAFGAAALLLSALWLFGLFQGYRSLPSLLLIAVALIQMLSHLRQFEFISPASTAMDTPLAVFVPVLSITLPLLYLLSQMKVTRHRLLYGCILGGSAAVALIPPAAGLFGVHSLDAAAFTQALYPALLALLVFAMLEARDGNRAFRLLLCGLGTFLAGAAVLYLGSLAGKGYYAVNMETVFRSMALRAPGLFLEWCGIALLILSVFIFLYTLIRRTARIHTELAVQAERSNLLGRDLQVQKQFYEARLSREAEIRALRHDIKGHLSTLTVLLHDNKTKEAETYLSGIIGRHMEPQTELFSQNPYLNAVLANYSDLCRKSNIPFICHVGIENHELPATELCLILNNALENALEASLKLPEADRKIKVQAAVRQGQLLLRISNRFDGALLENAGLPVTTKTGEGHGYGLYNIRQVAQHKGGFMEYRIKNGYFVLDVQFPLDRVTG